MYEKPITLLVLKDLADAGMINVSSLVTQACDAKEPAFHAGYQLILLTDHSHFSAHQPRASNRHLYVIRVICCH